MSELYVDLAIPASVNILFTYKVPAEMHEAIARGVRVIAPFGKRTVIGIVVGSSSVLRTERRLKSIVDVIDTVPIVSEEMLKLTEWIGRYYIAPWGDVLKAALVQGSTAVGKRTVRRSDSGDFGGALTARESALYSEIPPDGGREIQQLRKKTAVKGIYSVLAGLSRKGAVIIEEESPVPLIRAKTERILRIDDRLREKWKTWIEQNGEEKKFVRQATLLRELLGTEGGEAGITEFLRRTRQSLSTLRTLERKDLVEFGTREVVRTSTADEGFSEPPPGLLTLNPHQQKAFDAISEAARKESFSAFLLHGVTGSGKTQVYIEAIRTVLGMGKTAIVLVPEISLTPQTVHRFKHHFGEKVVSLHSRMSAGERYDAWRLIQKQQYSVVIGPRSAVFAPLNRLGLIVVDEEHENSFKQFDQTPRYHARDVAIMRASYAGATVVLGSATPSLESYDNALKGKYALLELPERVDVARMPAIEIVDMSAERSKKLSAFREQRKAEFKADYQKARASTEKLQFGIISDLLKERIDDRLQKKEGIILLQNRRGFAPIVECPECGYAATCENCSITLTYHLTKKHCRCHYCGFVTPPPTECPTCHSRDISLRGFGTQRIEEELKTLFPGAALIRMDLDTTTRRGSHHRMLQRFALGEADILLGTQMVAKGLDFSRVTLVGVISADTQMLLPDFRSAERTFQLLTQVAGRAGRSTLPGEVIIQTFQPRHYALKHVVDHDFKSFYAEELTFRSELTYPPYSRLVVCEFRGEHEAEVMKHAVVFGDILKETKSGCMILGPAPAALAKMKTKYRWHVVIKDPKISDPSGNRLHRALSGALERYRSMPQGKSRTVDLIVDVDPGSMM